MTRAFRTLPNLTKLMMLSLIGICILSACQSTSSGGGKRMVYSYPENTAPWERGQVQSSADNSPQGIGTDLPNGQRAPIDTVQSMPVGSGTYARQDGTYNAAARGANTSQDTAPQTNAQTAQNGTYANNGYGEYNGYSSGYNQNQRSIMNDTQDYQTASNYLNNAPSTQAPVSSGPVVKIGILLPLSGKHEELGQSMLQAAQLALFDMNYTNLELIPRDTKGTASGARTAAEEAVQQGAQMLLGPIFSHAVKGAKPISNQYGIPMLGFSTDWRVAGGNTFIMGVLPFAQAERIANFAARNNWRRIGIIAPSNAYGDAVTSAFRARAENLGLEIVDETRFASGSNNISTEVRSFARYDERKRALEQEVQRLKSVGKTNEARALEKQETGDETPYDAVFIPVGGDQAKSLINLLAYYDLGTDKVTYLGTGLWDESGIHAEPAAQGAYYAAPAPEARAGFENKYEATYGRRPPRLVSIAYDATALAVVLAQQGLNRYGRPDFTPQAILNPNGFSGIDGIFRFRRDGLVERSLAVHKIEGQSSRVIAPAATTFQQQGY